MSRIAHAVEESKAWMRALARTQRAPISWDRVALTAVGITAPVGLALLFAPTNDAVIGAGALASMGALVASAMDLGSAGIERVHRMALASMMATVGFAIGSVVHGHVVATLVAVIVAALLSGLSGAISATASKSALYFLVFTVTAANADFGLSSPWVAPLLFFAGAAWRLLLTMAAAAYEGRAFAPERRAVAGVYDALVAQLSAETTASRTAAGTALTDALNDAYDVLVAARTELAAHDRRWQTLVAVLNASAPVVDAAIATAEDGRDADSETLDFLRGVAAWVSNPARPVPSAPRSSGGDPALAASLAHVGRVVDGIRTMTSVRALDGTDLSLPATPSVGGRLRSAGRALTSGTELWNSILRLVLCIAVAQALCAAWQLERPYLVMLTVAQVMKPDFGSIFGRAVQRGVGTLIGVVIGALAVAVIPRDGWQILVILVLAASIPIVMPRNYGLYSIVTTPLAVLLVELHVSDSSSLVEIRLLDTLLGCAIVLLLGYLPWPQTWHAPRHLAVPMAALASAIGDYARVALARPDDPDRPTLRRAVYRRISDVRTRVAKSLAEPPSISAAAASWLPEVAALERVTDAVTAAAIEAEASGVTHDPQTVDAVAAALDDVAEAIAARRPPADVDLPDGQLPAVAGDVATVRSALVAQQIGAESRRAARVAADER